MTPNIKKLLRTACIALGLTSVYLLFLLAPLGSRAHIAIYHWSGAPSELFIPPVLDFCIFWVLTTLVLVLTEAPGRLHAAVWSGIIFFTPRILLSNWVYLTAAHVDPWVSTSLFWVGVLAVLLTLVFWRSTFEMRLEQVEKFVSTLLLFSAVAGTTILFRVAWFGWKARSLNDVPLTHKRHTELMEGARPRIIWILFDELSYQQVYERRFPGLRLPAFDALAAEATVFTHTIPAGVWTERVLPSLIAGETVDAVSSSSDGRRLSLLDPGSAKWRRFDQRDSVFQDALNLNYRTAVAGSYNPYCRILSDVLDSCFWIQSAPAANTMVPQTPLLSNMIMPVRQALGSGLPYRIASLFLRFPDNSEFAAKQHIVDYAALVSASDRILDDPSTGFCLIHLPVPHPGGIYDRVTDEFVTAHASYLDNLVLADRLLGHIRSELEESKQWDNSTIVLMGDHSWRTTLIWKDLPDWTDEEEIASHGEFDDRPAYVVKLAGQRAGFRIDERFAALNSRMLFDALLSQKIRSPEDLSAWAKRRAN
jgi:Sulfatase